MTGLPIFLRPSVKFQEIDLTQRVQLILSTVGSIVGEFERGSLEPTYLDGLPETFYTNYGRVANVRKYGYAHDTVTSLLTQSSNALIKRVVNSAKYSGATIVNDKDRNRWLGLPFVDGTLQGHATSGLTPLVLISFAGDLITGNTFALDITDGQTVTPITPVVYATDHNTTMNNIAASVLAALNTFGPNNSVQVYTETTSSTAKNHLIVVRPSRALSLSFLNAELTLGVTQTEVNVYEDAALFDMYAENPGEWSKDYGYKITAVDPGVRERFRITLSQAMVTGNSFSVKVNGTPLAPVVFATSSDATLAAIATALQALPEIASATVEVQPGPTDNDRSILVVAQKPGAGQIKLTDAAVTSGASQPIVVVTQVLRGTAPDNTFRLEIYNRADLTRTDEAFTVTLGSQISALGGQQNIEHVVNKASNRSKNIRIVQSADSLDLNIYDPVTGDAPAMPGNILFLAGGDDGVKPTSADIRQAWQTLNDRVTYPFSVMLNAGYTQISVQKEMVAIAEQRSDCMAILDAPSDKQRAQDLRTYRLEELDIDSSYAAMYTPDVEIEDINTGEKRFIPPSGPIGATYAYSDRLTNFLGAPAGLNRGKITLALGLRHKYMPAEEELLHPIGINCIIDKRGIGPVVMGEETLQFKKSVLSSVHARRILNMIKTGLVDGLEYTLFDPNTEFTRTQARQLGDTILKPIKKGGGLYDYRQVCDERNNTPDVIDADALAYDVYLKIVRVVKGIMVRGILTRTGASFEELIDEMSTGEA